MDDLLLEIAIDALLKRLNTEIEHVQNIEYQLKNLNAALPIHMQLRDEYQALADKYAPDWQAMMKRRMDREKLWRKME